MAKSESQYTYPRPQQTFSEGVDNSNDRPQFQPTLPFKHHAMVPYDPSPSDNKQFSSSPSSSRKPSIHPYEYETRNLSYPTSMFISAPPIHPKPLSESAPEWVDTPEALSEMTEELKLATEIAVDLEHHDLYSYYGFTCLMQISTRTGDWLIDTLKLRDALREDKLGGVFADPNIVKVRLALDYSDTRFSMVPNQISYGFKRTLTSTLSISSTLIMPLKC